MLWSKPPILLRTGLKGFNSKTAFGISIFKNNAMRAAWGSEQKLSKLKRMVLLLMRFDKCV